MLDLTDEIARLKKWLRRNPYRPEETEDERRVRNLTIERLGLMRIYRNLRRREQDELR
jgi:hypothetical protein